MAILRKVKSQNYVVVDKGFVNDERLSWKAKGIMVYLLSLPDDWKFYIEELITHATDGEKGFRTGFKELEKYGYVKRFPVRDGRKIIEWDTVVYENPLLVEKVDVVSDDLQKDALLSNNNKLSNKELINNNNINAATLIKLFEEVYREKYNVNYTVDSYVKAGNILKTKVLKPYPDIAEDIIRLGVEKYEDLFKSVKYPRPSIAMFSWAVNQIVAVIEEENKLTDEIDAIDEDAIEKEMLEKLARLNNGKDE